MLKSISAQLPNEYRLSDFGDIEVSLRQLEYPRDMELLHKWMHYEHVIPQWQLNKSLVDLSVHYEKALADDHQRIYLVGVNGQWVGYTEIYEGARDRLGRYYDSDSNDLGWHLLIGETSAYGKGLLRAIIRMLSHFIFDHSEAKRVVGEPDHTVKPYEVVARDMCYEPQRLIPMPEKVAMLYYCPRDVFLAKYPKQTETSVL
ncbi:GNAT family N-acetyltransferase [Aquirhabdus sp.]|uniref:GNAT family N-acetyltransferase n=1 Tax=Aquirhabdus sp. TaxID=2824160 RepID=UPI00396C98AE